MQTFQVGLPSVSRQRLAQQPAFLRTASSKNGGRLSAKVQGNCCHLHQRNACSSIEPDQDAPQHAAESGRVAWNKGRAMPACTKKKLSRALKLKWKDAEHRATVSAKLKVVLQGVEPWNKGRTLSEETRRKMSEAKRNRTTTKATRRRMSESHKGKTHSQETVRQLSLQMTGQPKSINHREQIALGQRRRHAAARVLRAVEAVYEAQGDASPVAASSAAPGAKTPVAVKVTAAVASAAAGAAPKLAPAATPPTGAASPSVADGSGALQSSRLAAYRMASGRGQGGAGASGSGKGKKQRRLSKGQILAEYKAELQEYRALQDELSPWSSAFLEKHGRKPGMQDVAATGIPWLIARYKRYVLLRDRLFTDTGTLRGRLENAIPEVGSAPNSINNASLGTGSLLGGAGASGAGKGSWAGAAGAGAEQRSSAALRFSAAMEYKASKKGGMAAAAPASPSGAADPPGSENGGEQMASAGGCGVKGLEKGDFPLTALLVGDDLATGGAIGAEGEGREGQEGTSPLPSAALLPAAGADPTAAGAAEALAGEEDGSLASLGVNVPPRVKLAMRAAQEYRLKRAQATKAAASAAAAAAKAKPPLPAVARLGRQHGSGAAGLTGGEYVPPPKLRGASAGGKLRQGDGAPSGAEPAAALAASTAEPAAPASSSEEDELTALLVGRSAPALGRLGEPSGAGSGATGAAGAATIPTPTASGSLPSSPAPAGGAAESGSGGGGGAVAPDLVPCSPAPSL